MSRPHITSFIVKTDDYFTAHLDNGAVRIGMVSYYSFEFMPEHEHYQAVINAKNAASVEALFDTLYDKYVIQCKANHT